ncbi:hypothetical protein D3C71_1858130 [compost metagenome]
MVGLGGFAVAWPAVTTNAPAFVRYWRREAGTDNAQGVLAHRLAPLFRHEAPRIVHALGQLLGGRFNVDALGLQAQGHGWAGTAGVGGEERRIFQ